MDEVPHFRKADYPLHGSAPTCGTGTSSSISIRRPAPLAAQLGALPAKFRAWRMEDLRLGHRIVYDVKANWKLIVQNYNECLHCPNLHPALNKLSHYLSGENEPLQPTYMGGRMDLRPGVDTLSMDGTCRARFCRALRPTSAARLLLRDLPEHAAQPAPRLHDGAHALAARAGPDDQRLRVALPSAELREPGFDPDDAIEFWDMTNRQDWHVCELSQAGISSRAYTPGPYSNREDLLYAFDRMIVGLHDREVATGASHRSRVHGAVRAKVND